MKNAGILTIGNEIMQGFTLDTNAKHISKELTARNIKVTIHLSVPDVKSKIIEKIDKFITKDYDYIFVTGGLGPTHDDITRDSLKEMFKCKLKFYQKWNDKINSKFTKTNIPRNQSEILEIAEPLENNVGTALGMHFKYKKSHLIILPGVPHEMKSMFKLFLDLNKKEFKKNIQIFTINTAGIYETKLSNMMQPFIEKYKNDIYFSFLPSYNGVKLRVEPLNNKTNLSNLKNILVEYLNDFAFGFDDTKIEKVIFNLLSKNNKTLSIAESCSGGGISEHLTNLPGISKIFIGSIIAYSNEIKNKVLGIPNSIITKHGAVSEKVATEMAVNIKNKFNTDISIACTGISGPGGGTKEKPIGTVFISVCVDDTIITKKFIFKIDRLSHKTLTRHTALYMLWRLIIKLKY
tara:strand:- start:5240 stop:6457 length:1218 start_codon:yes stop_codon:yes gene_type:complete